MGRPQKLSEDQRTEIKRRLIDGAKPADLAREYKVSKAMISGISKRVQEVQTVANQVVSAERALGSLPVSEQLLTVSLASKLRSISDSLASAADLGAKTGHRLHALANSEVGKVDDADPLSVKSIDSLKGVGVLTKLANESLVPAMNILAANRDTVKRIHEESEDEPEDLTPERMQEGTRRLAFLLEHAARQPA